MQSIPLLRLSVVLPHAIPELQNESVSALRMRPLMEAKQIFCKPATCRSTQFHMAILSIPFLNLLIRLTPME